MSSEITTEQKEQIIQLVDQAIEKGLIAQAISKDLSNEAQLEFQRVMGNRLVSEVNQAETVAGITHDYTHLGAKDFIKEQNKKLREALCDKEGKLKGQYKTIFDLGSDEIRGLIIGLIEIVVASLSPVYRIPTIALPLVLMIIREGLDNWCIDSMLPPTE